MAPKEEIEISFAYKYTMYECGMELLTFGKPIEDPLVTVEVPESLRARVVYSNRAPTKMDEAKPDFGYLSVPMKGVLLPLQVIRVLWMTAKQLQERQATL